MEHECQLARFLSQLPGVHSVLALGTSQGLVQALQNAGLEVEGRDWHAAASGSASRTYDLALCLCAPNVTPGEGAAIAAALATRSGRVLFSPVSRTACAVWLRAFLAAGYSPDLTIDIPWAGAGAVLLRSGAAEFDEAAILAELLHLRTRFPDGSSANDSSDQGLAAWCAELERAVQSIRELTSESLEREETFLQRADLRFAQLHARTNQLSHTVQTMAQSRIWRALVAAGVIQESPSPSTAPPVAEKPTRGFRWAFWR